MSLLRKYIEKFESLDGGKFEKFFDGNSDIFTFLSENLPVFECEDKTLEEIYYFRAYTFAKHIKINRNGKFIITEWLDFISWQKETDGAISCPVGHHLRELIWLKNGAEIAKDYIRFWCENIKYLSYYNNWFVYAVWEYCEATGNMDFAYSVITPLIEYFEHLRSQHKALCGLYKCVDNYDGMELSISGYGVRTTINSYVYANAYGLYKILEYGGERERAEDYRHFAEDLRGRINAQMFKKDFYYNLPLEAGEEMPRFIPNFSNPNQKYGVKELTGYVPWYFGIPTEKENVAWKYTVDKKVFLQKYGFATADVSDEQFGYEFPHMCLWNGPVWPFATSQTLTGLYRVLQRGEEMPIGKKEYCKFLKTYAKSQYRIDENGTKRPWIDENLDGNTGEWIARQWLIDNNRYDIGRGRDYNHSSYLDLILGGLVGAGVENGEVVFKPLADGEQISSFSVKGLRILNKDYDLRFENGELKIL